LSFFKIYEQKSTLQRSLIYEQKSTISKRQRKEQA
jgi:hypothetical protein